MFQRLTQLIRSQFFKARAATTSRKHRSSSGVECLEDRALLSALTWSPGVDLPAPRAGATAVDDGYATFLIGGSTTTVNTLYPGASSWGAGSSIDIARTYAGVGFTGSAYLVYGGQAGNAVLGEALTYDPYNIDNVQDAATMNPPRTQFGYATDDAHHPYAIGGLDEQHSPLSSVAMYDPTSDSWTTVADLPQALYAESAVYDGNGHLYTFGGVNAGSVVTNSVYRYTVATDTWDVRTSMPVAERDGAAVLASNGKIYVLGGSSMTSVLSTVQSYDPETDTWTLETDLPAPVSSAAGVSDSAGHILVIGGYDQNHASVTTVSVSQQLNAPDSAPAFSSSAPASIMVGSTYTYQVTTIANPQATYSLVSAPAGMSIDAGRGLITWVPTASQAGLNTVTVRATNVAGTADQTFAVRALTPAPTTPIEPAVAGVSTNSVTLSWNASTDSVGVAGYRVYRVSHTGFHGITTVYSKVADVAGTSATLTGLTAGTTYQYVVSAYNASGNESTRSSSVSARTLSPIIYTGPTTVAATAEHPLSFTLSASANPAEFAYTALDPADGMTVNPTTGLVSWTPTDADVGTNYFTFRIDHILGSVTVQVSIQVGNNLPYATYTPIGSAVATQPYSVQFSRIADAYNTAPVTYSMVSGPAEMVIDPATGLLSWTPTLADVGTASVSVQISNYAGSTSCSVNIPVVFASAARNVAISHITTTSATVTWDAPLVAAEPLAGYTVTASYRVRSGRFNTTHTLTFTAASTDNRIEMSGLPTNKLLNVAVTPFDTANRKGLPERNSFTTAAATPTITVTGGPFTSDGTPHSATATALGVGGATPVEGTFTFTYDGSSVPPTLPGTYVVVASFTSGNSYYADAVGSGTLTISPGRASFTITANPLNQATRPGHAVTFFAAAAGNPAPTVQWQISTDGGSTYTNINGATSNVYRFRAIASQNGNLYRAVYSDKLEEIATTAASLTVLAPPIVLRNPVSQSVIAGNSVTFTVAASADPEATLQWQVSINHGASYSNIAGATDTSLTMAAEAGQTGYLYRAVFTNRQGTATTTAAVLTVHSAPVVTSNPISRSQHPGRKVIFTATATGDPAPAVQWQVSADGGLTFEDIAGATRTTLRFRATSAQNNTFYRAVFTNSLGIAITTAAVLTV